MLSDLCDLTEVTEHLVGTDEELEIALSEFGIDVSEIETGIEDIDSVYSIHDLLYFKYNVGQCTDCEKWYSTEEKRCPHCKCSELYSVHNHFGGPRATANRTAQIRERLQNDL